MKSVGVAVVGAGPYGLAVASHLRGAKVPFRIFGTAMDSWVRHMPKGMFLKSEGFASSISDPESRLTLRRYCAETGSEYGDVGVPVPIETFVEYGRWFQRTAVPDLEEVDVAELRADNGGFALQLSSGETARAAAVVVATGFVPFPHIPPELENLPPTLLSHTSEHTSFDDFTGREVAVVGGGQSAIETAALLREQGATPHVVLRKPRVVWNEPPSARTRSVRSRVRAPVGTLGAGWKLWSYSNLPQAFRWFPQSTRAQLAWTTLGPAGAWWLRERVEPEVSILAGHRIGSASVVGTRARLELANGDAARVLDVDHVIAGTGYRVRLDRLEFIDQDLRARVRVTTGIPDLSRHFESSVPGLYFVGIPAATTFGPAMRFVCGSGFAARRVASHAGRVELLVR